VVAWAFAASEDGAAPRVVAQTRQRTAGQRGVPWISDGREVYRREVQRVYRDPQRLGKRGRPRLVPTPGVELTQAVKHRCGGKVVRIEVHQVLGQPCGIGTISQGPAHRVFLCGSRRTLEWGAA
jgi:hypothetical protein